MTCREFMILVAMMRTAQKEYFKTRSVEPLKLSKNLEKQVDEILAKTALTEAAKNERG